MHADRVHPPLLGVILPDDELAAALPGFAQQQGREGNPIALNEEELLAILTRAI